VAAVEGALGPQHRCFAVSHAQMDPSAPPLLVAHASLLGRLPSTLHEAALGDAASEAAAPQAACLWALGAPETPGLAGALRGLGVGQVLRREATRMLREELGAEHGAAVTALAPLRGFASWLRATRAWERPGLGEAGEALRRALLAGGREVQREVSFVDADGDTVAFRLRVEEGEQRERVLEVEVGGGAPRRVLKLVVASEARAVRFLMEPGPEAMQVNMSPEAVDSGELTRVTHLAEAAGMLPAELRDPVLKFAYEFITRRGADGARSAEPAVHFHMSGGAALHALHWRADESPAGLAEALGVMASFAYRGPEVEGEAAGAYAARGLDAATFTM